MSTIVIFITGIIHSSAEPAALVHGSSKNARRRRAFFRGVLVDPELPVKVPQKKTRFNQSVSMEAVNQSAFIRDLLSGAGRGRRVAGLDRSGALHEGETEDRS